MLITPKQMIAAEKACLAEGGDAGALMKQAGEGIARSVRGFFPEDGKPGSMILALGPDNNAGDACVLAQVFAASGWTIRYFTACPDRPLSELTKENLDKIKGDVGPLENPSAGISEDLPRPLVLVDGLLGIGSRLPLEGGILDAAKQLNLWRQEDSAFTVAIDIPTGLDGESGDPSPETVIADLTTSICRAKTGLVADAATEFVGRLAVIPLPQVEIEADTDERVFRPDAGKQAFSRPPHTVHKTKAGRVLIIAGSPGLTGAAVLAATAALRTGAGMVTVMTDPRSVADIASKSPPEIMVRPLREVHDIDWNDFDALCIGPGLGRDWDRQVIEILQVCQLPATIDADAINAISRAPAHRRELLLFNPAAPRLITPHHGELLRIFPRAGEITHRADIARAFIDLFPETALLYKGARTIVACKQGQKTRLWYNSSGHSGMASAGMGDTLSGICTTYLARNFDARLAGSAGAWIHGRAAEIATYYHHPRTATDSLTASDVIDHIGSAIVDLREHITY